MTRLRGERGQAIVVTVIVLVALLGMAALVLDVGSWFQTQRRDQATADAAALAGAQALSSDPAGAASLALQYADANGGGLAPSGIAITSELAPNDTISVTVARPAPSFFAKIFGIGSVGTSAGATARAELPAEAQYVAPMVVSKKHPLLSGPGCPCFKVQTSLPFDKLGAPGAFGMLDLSNGNGTLGSSTEAQWIAVGFDKFLPLGNYDSDPGAKFSSGNVQAALQDRVGTDLLFPVFSVLSGTGSNAQYTVVGWVGFHLTGYSTQGNSATLDGYFTRYITQGIQSTTSGNQPDFGVRTISLVG